MGEQDAQPEVEVTVVLSYGIATALQEYSFLTGETQDQIVEALLEDLLTRARLTTGE